MEHESKPTPPKNNNVSIVDVLTPVQTFIGGIVSGILLLCTIGFFILLTMFVKGGFPESTAVAASDTEPTTLTQPAQPAAAQPAISLRSVDPKNDHIRGNENAKITIVEYSDFECPFCKRFHGTMQQVIDTYGDDVRWVYRQFPIDQLHRKARTEALASECAAEQGKFWEWADLIFATTNGNDSLDLAKLPTYAGQIGLNVNQFNTCVESEKYLSAVQEDERDAASAGAQGTPYSVLITPDGEMHPISGAQPYSSVEAVIKQFL